MLPFWPLFSSVGVFVAGAGLVPPPATVSAMFGVVVSCFGSLDSSWVCGSVDPVGFGRIILGDMSLRP